jgi:hypothetical protein
VKIRAIRGFLLPFSAEHILIFQANSQIICRKNKRNIQHNIDFESKKAANKVLARRFPFFRVSRKTAKTKDWQPATAMNMAKTFKGVHSSVKAIQSTKFG